MLPKFFATPADWRNWLEKHHADSHELLVGYYKKGSGKPSITWPESVDVALCFGWIDGVRRRIDDVSYSIRFTPRKPRSIWSAVNIKRVEALTASGLMHASGVEAFQAREHVRSRVYSFEQGQIEFSASQEKQFRNNKSAWIFFRSKAAWYQKAATCGSSAPNVKRPETSAWLR
jgi:hypothetical protein